MSQPDSFSIKGDVGIDMFFELLQQGLDGRNEWYKVEGVISNELFHLAHRQGVSAFCLDGLQRVLQRPENSNFQIDKSLKLSWIASVMKQEQTYEIQWQAAKALGDYYAANGIDTYVMKGFSLSRLYPKPNHRPCTDMDCFLVDKDTKQCVYEKGNLLAEKKGVGVDRSYYKHSEIMLKGLTVENHQFLLPIKGSGKAKKFEKELRCWIDNGENEYIEGTKLKATSPFFDAVFVLAHAQEHFLNDGIALRHICDWAMVLKAYSDKVDWKKWRSVCHEYGMLSFGYAMSRLAKRVCGVNIPFDCPVDNRADRRLLDNTLYANLKDQTGKSDMQIRFGLIKQMFTNGWKYRMFSDTNFLMFGARRIWGYLFDKDLD